MSETAFLMMDLEEHGRHDLAYRFLNRYLQYTGDYEGLRVLRFYKVYRAMVRAKVSCLRQAQAATQQKEKIATQQQFHEYLDFAEHYTHPSVTALIITHGLSGSGKTTVTQPLMEHQDAVRIRSDIERKRLHGLSAQQKSSSGIEADIYSVKASIETYQRLADLSVAIIESGYPVIVDATFLKHDQRSLFQELAREHNIPFVILDFHAPEELLRQWIIERAEVGYDVSEADIPVLEHQQETREPLSKDELQCTVHIDTGQKVDIDEIIIRLNKLIYAAT